MKLRKFTEAELEFVDKNSHYVEIKYYQHFAKKHRIKPSSFNIKKGYFLLLSDKIKRHFRKCEIVDIIEYNPKHEIHYKNIKDLL